MSFFKDFKSDFTQAMNELMPDSNEMYDEDEWIEDEVNSDSKTDVSSKSSKKSKNEKKEDKFFKNSKGFKGNKASKKETVSKEDQQVTIQDEEEIAPEDLSDQIDDLLDQELYSDDDIPVLPDDMEVNTMDMSVEDLLNQLSEKNETSGLETVQEQDAAVSDMTETVNDEQEMNQSEISASSGHGSDEQFPENSTESEDSYSDSADVSYQEPDMGLEALLDSIASDESESVNETQDMNNLEDELSVQDVSTESEMSDNKDTQANQEFSEEQAEDSTNEDLLEKIEDLEYTEESSEGREEGFEEPPKEEEETNPEESIIHEGSIAENEEQVSAKDEASKEKENDMTEEKDVIAISAVEDSKTEQKEESKPETSYHETDVDTTYITKGTKIKGDLETDGSIDIIGKVEGNVSCQGKVVVGGQVLGDITAGELYANNAKIEGSVKSYGSVKVGVGSMIVGGIEGESAVIAGAVNGDIDVKGPVIVDSTAVIMGNIKSRSVQINNGAVIEGFCSQTYSDIDVKSFFA